MSHSFEKFQVQNCLLTLGSHFKLFLERLIYRMTLLSNIILSNLTKEETYPQKETYQTYYKEFDF